MRWKGLRKVTVVILIDALGFEIAKKHSFNIEGLDTRVVVKTTLGFSQSAIISILSSLPATIHGKWMMYSFNSDTSPFKWTKFFPDSLSDGRRWFRRLINYKLRRIDGIESYYSLYSIPKHILPYIDIPLKRDYFRTHALEDNETVFDKLKKNKHYFKVWDFKVPESLAFNMLKDEVKDGRGGFYFLYTAEFDSLLHYHGTGSHAIKEKLEYYREKIEELYALLKGKYDDVRLFVFGDHGMCDVHMTLDIISIVEELGLKIPDDYIPFYDSTMARFRVLSEKARRVLVEELSKIDGGTILDDSECKRLSIPVPSKEFGDIVFLLETGKLILPSFMGTEMVNGMHGYHPDSPCMDSIFLSNVTLSRSEINLFDIADILLEGY